MLSRLVLPLAVLLLSAPVALADTVDPLAEPVVAQLAREGYSGIRVDETWLGRIRVIAMIDGRRREVILHPTSGAILRDYLEPAIRLADGIDIESSMDDGDDDDHPALGVLEGSATAAPGNQSGGSRPPPAGGAVGIAAHGDVLLLPDGN